MQSPLTRHLEQGSTVTVPATVEHEILNVGDGPLRLVRSFKSA